jgi:cold-inducible RNA-binding protein
MSMKLYVGNLAFQTSSEELQTLFAQAGTVESVSLIEDRETGRSRGFGFVEMSTKEEGAAAIQQFNGKDLGGRALNVNEAKPREDRGGGGGGRNGGSRYSVAVTAYSKPSARNIAPGAFCFCGTRVFYTPKALK